MVVTLLRFGLTAAAWDRILDELVASGLLHHLRQPLGAAHSDRHARAAQILLRLRCAALETEVLQASQPLSKTGIETGSIIQR